MFLTFVDSFLGRRFDLFLHLLLLGGFVALIWRLEHLDNIADELLSDRDLQHEVNSQTLGLLIQNNKYLFENQKLIIESGAKCANN